MRVFEDLKIGKSAKYTVKNFESLPDMAKELMFAAFNALSVGNHDALAAYWDIAMGDYCECKSPIEKILHVAIDFVCILRIKEFGDWNFGVFPQQEIHCNDKKYIADFMILIEKCKGDICDDDVKYFVVECDGYEYHHANKEQVTRDNERDLQIKTAGYDVLRFSGSQIYKKPMKCANDIIDYALSKIGK